MSILTSIAMISCKQAAYLGSKSAFGSLSVLEGWKLKMHLKLCTCETCHDFAKDSELIDDAIDKIMKEREHRKFVLTEEQRRKIIELLK